MKSFLGIKGKGADSVVPKTPDPTKSSSINSNDVSWILSRDNLKCILCQKELDGLEVSHIIARTTRANWQWHWIRATNLDPQFAKTDRDNLMTLCPSHHSSFDEFCWVLVPAVKTLDWLIGYEERDYTTRSDQLMIDLSTNPNAQARGRQVPDYEDWRHRNRSLFNYVPLHFGSTAPGFDDYSCNASKLVILDTNPVLMGPFPQTMTYSLIPDLSPPRELKLTNVHRSQGEMIFTVELRYDDPTYNPWGLRLNPFALISHALSAISGAFCPPIFNFATNGSLVQYAMLNGVEEYEEKLIHLRTLYNRLPPTSQAILSSQRKSTETIKASKFPPLAYPPGASGEPSTSSHYGSHNQYQGQSQGQGGSYGTGYNNTLKYVGNSEDAVAEATMEKDMKALTVR